MTNSIYSNIIEAKNGSLIPVLKDGKTIDSKYNPDHEAEVLMNSIPSTFSFFIVTGISSGIIIKKISETFPNAKLICLERNNEDITFLETLPIIKELEKNKNIIFSTVETIYQNIIDNYLPSKYGEIKIIERHGWLQANNEFISAINQQISKAIGIVSADYSVQVHFGNIWQKNILNNLKLLSETKNQNTLQIDVNKTAYVVAAGPSLDKTINLIKQDSNAFVISTDTAYSTLIKSNIYPDVLVSIDGQNISSNHFLNINTNKTTFVLDLCCNASASQHIIDENGKIIFFKSGHPFSELADIYMYHKLPALFSGSGTVTIAATDFAIKSGFKNIFVLGADFGYSDGKAYAQGTYFDVLYNKDTNRMISNENNFNHLMYRTELEQENNKQTTTILKAYKQSFIDFLEKNKVTYKEENNIYEIKSDNKKTILIESVEFNYSNFLKYINSLSQQDLEIPLLPYIAWLRNKNKELNFEELLNLAYSHILSYN